MGVTILLLSTFGFSAKVSGEIFFNENLAKKAKSWHIEYIQIIKQS